MTPDDRHPDDASPVVDAQRAIQAESTAAEERAPEPPDGPVQAGTRPYPAPPFPERQQPKPGEEAVLDPAPMYDNPDYKGSGKLDGMVALITGGDSGIGRSVAVFFAREGADVAIVHLPDEARDADVVKKAVEAEGRRCLSIAGDVADRAFCDEAVETTVRELGKLDVLVNNAAFQQHQSRIEDISDEHFDRTIRTNLYGYFYMARAAMRHLKAGGSIINTGSITGIDGSKELIDYSMTKGGIHAFTRALSGAVAPRGIRVNAVAPGPVWTPLNPSDKDAEAVAQFGASTTMKRPAQPEELAPLYVYLASPACSSYVTGEIIPVIGGY